MRASAVVAALLGAFALCAAGAPAQKKDKKGPSWIPPDATVHRDLAYAKVGEVTLRLDLVLPADAPAPAPLVIWVHGGGWSGGNKNSVPPNDLVQHGFAVASVQYRLSGQAIFPAAILDVKSAVRWLRANAKKYNLDPKRFGAWGSSAGGHLVALLGTSGGEKDFEAGENLKESSRVQAVCDFFGPTDFTKMNEQAKNVPGGSKIDHDSEKAPEARFLGGAVPKNKDKAAKANPITYVSKDDPPFLLMHGDRDGLVPLGQSELLAAALKKAGVEVELVVHKGAGHGGAAFTSAESRKKVRGFFERHLKKS